MSEEKETALTEDTAGEQFKSGIRDVVPVALG